MALILVLGHTCLKLSRIADPFPFIAWRRERVWPTAIELPVLAFTQGRVSVNWFEVNGQPMSLGPWLPAYLKPMNTHPTLGEGQNGKIYGSGPDPFPPPRNKRERVCYARLVFRRIGISNIFGRCS